MICKKHKKQLCKNV